MDEIRNLMIIIHLNPVPQPMLHRIERRPIHIIAACDRHFLYPETCSSGIGDHLGFNAHAGVVELEGFKCVLGESAETALGIVYIDLAVQVGSKGQDLLAYAAVCRNSRNYCNKYYLLQICVSRCLLIYFRHGLTPINTDFT